MVQVIYEVTYACPGKCPFCPIRNLNLQEAYQGSVPVGTYAKVLKLFKEYFSDGDYAVVISGGEPGTLPSLRDYVTVGRELGYAVTVVTNAFNPKRVVESSPDFIEVSIDYFGERHDRSRGVTGLFERALILIALADRVGIPAVVRSTVMKDNVEDLIKLREHLDKEGYLDVQILAMPVRGAPSLKPTQEQLQALARDGIQVSDNCPAGISSFVVMPNNEVIPCIFYRETLGYLKKMTIKELEKIAEKGRKIPRFPCEINVKL